MRKRPRISRDDGDASYLDEAIKALEDAASNPRNADSLRQILEARQQVANAKVESYLPVSVLVPYVNRAGVEGEVTWREWGLWGRSDNTGLLGSITWYSKWEGSQFFADFLPTPSNKSGIYSYSLNARGIRSLPLYFYSRTTVEKSIFGFIEIRGKAVHHSDGVVRSEYARILHLIIPTGIAGVSGAYQALTNNYPDVPVSILNPCQLYEMIFREAVIEFIRFRGYEVSHV